MKVYRMLTGPDDAVFCRRVTEALQHGWDLYGSPTMTHTPDGVQVGQAVVKDVEGVYDPDKPLHEY